MDERLDMEVLVICMGDTPWAFEGHQKDKLKGTKKLQLDVGAQRALTVLVIFFEYVFNKS